jgi:hypothetical protein
MVREFLDYKIVIGTTNYEEAIERQTNIVVVIPSIITKMRIPLKIHGK